MEVAFEKILRGVVRLGIGGLLIGGVSIELFPQIPRELFGLKNKGGVFVKIPNRCREQFVEVAKKFGLKNPDKVSLFVNRRLYGGSAGSNLLPCGAVLALPRWYLYQTPEEVKNSGIQLPDGMSWESEVGRSVTQNFLASNDMIAFTIGHELAHIDQQLQFKLFYTCAPPLWLYVTYRVASATRRLFKLHIVLDVLLKLGIFGLNYHAYKFVNQEVTYLAEFHADEISAKCDPQMAKGGVDFFTMALKQNLIQRKLLGDKGKEIFTEEGNDLRKSYVLSGHPQLTERLDRVKAILHGNP